MPVEQINGLGIAYEVIGQGEPWAITPGGRFSKDSPGVRELAQALAATGKRVLIWDRPNTGASEVCFDGDSESVMQADVLAGLLRRLELTPAVIAGGSGGSRVSLLTAARHPDVARALAVWWISGGPYGLLTLGTHYCGDSIAAAWRYGMEAVAALPEWGEVLERNPANQAKLLAQEPRAFIETLEQWMLTYCPRPDELVPGLPDVLTRAMDLPALVFRSGASDPHHTRGTSEQLAQLLPQAQLVEPPWGDREWTERTEEAASGVGIFSRWPLLAPQLIDWAAGL
jgi:pimeloyl-ACP methyl ester carboxylesterase